MLLNNIFKALLILSLCIINVQTVKAEEISVKAKEIFITEKKTKKSLIIKVSNIILGTLALEICYLTSNNQTQQTLIDQLRPTKLLKNFVKEYSTHFIANSCHELGHACMAKAINGDSINIHLGGNTGDNDTTPLFSSKHFTLDGLSSCAGHSIYSTPIDLQATLTNLTANYCKKNNIKISKPSRNLLIKIFKEALSSQDKVLKKALVVDKKKQAAILMAGGLAGILSNVVMKLLSSSKYNFQLDSLTINQLFNMLVPFSINGKAHSDASKLYRQYLDTPQSTLDRVEQLAPYLNILSEIWLAKRHSSDNSSIHSLVLLGLANYFLRGYLSFHT